MDRADPKKQSTALENVTIVLVSPRGSGNVGSVARAMRNTGLSDLALIDPCEFTNDEALSMACKADSLLRGARVFDSLDAYAPGGGVLVGATRRMGKLRHPLLTLDEAAENILSLAAGSPVSILFGREDRGLTNEETAICDILFEIPACADYPSINLSHAVLLVCHHLWRIHAPAGPSFAVAPRVEVEEMYAHLEAALRSIEYGERGGEHLLSTIMRNFRRLFGRTGLMQKEINMLRGIFTQIEARAGGTRAGERTGGRG